MAKTSLGYPEVSVAHMATAHGLGGGSIMTVRDKRHKYLVIHDARHRNPQPGNPYIDHDHDQHPKGWI